MFEFPVNYLFITAAVAEDSRFDNNSGLVGDDQGSTFMMMRKRNSTSFKMNTGLGFQARWNSRSGRACYGMGRVIGNTFQWYIQSYSEESTGYENYQFNKAEVIYAYVAF